MTSLLGRNTIILKGVTTIENNVIIGAGNIVSKNCEGNSVYVGNLTKRVYSIENMYDKRKK